MAESCYSSVTSKICVNPLKEDSNINVLKKFEELIRTSIGPYGKLILVKNASGGLVLITSSSQRFFPVVFMKNTFLKLIASSTKLHLDSYNDNGLSYFLLTVKLINDSLSLSCSLPVTGKLIEYFGNLFVEYLNVDKNACIQTMDLSNLTYFQSVVMSILSSKPGCILNKEGKQHLCILLMKIYLNSIPSSLSDAFYKNINFVTLEGMSCDQSSVHEGLLVRLSEMPQKINSQLYSNSNIKIVLYTSSLSGDADFPVDKIEVTEDINVWEAVLNHMKTAIKKILKAEIHIFACQKVVHPSLRKQLEDSNVLVLDRLGHEVTKHLEYISGVSNSSLFEEPSFGYLTSLNQIKIGQKSFLLLSNKPKAFWTMLICNFNEHAVNETKIVCQQVISSLIRLLKKPFVCFGGGCTEVHTSKLVVQKVLQDLQSIQCDIGCKVSEILEALQIFEQSIVNLAVAFHQGSTLNVATEKLFGHLWKLKNGNFPSENDRCLCEQFSADDISSSDWKMLTKCGYQSSELSAFPATVNGEVNKSVILDELSSKVNAYTLAFNTASSLLKVSMLVCN